jgi:hypothetical protein
VAEQFLAVEYNSYLLFINFLEPLTFLPLKISWCIVLRSVLRRAFMLKSNTFLQTKIASINTCSFRENNKQNKLRGLSRQANYTDLPSDRRMSAKLVPTFANRGCRVVSATDPHGRILGFIDRSRFSIQLAPQLYSRGWVDPVPDPLLLRKFVAPGNEPGTSGSVARNSDH